MSGLGDQDLTSKACRLMGKRGMSKKVLLPIPGIALAQATVDHAINELTFRYFKRRQQKTKKHTAKILP
jgi:hypothetical protein